MPEVIFDRYFSAGPVDSYNTNGFNEMGALSNFPTALLKIAAGSGRENSPIF
jgi:hypothetical protein